MSNELTTESIFSLYEELQSKAFETDWKSPDPLATDDEQLFYAQGVRYGLRLAGSLIRTLQSSESVEVSEVE